MGSRTGRGVFLLIKDKKRSAARTSALNEFVTRPPPPGGDDGARAVVSAARLGDGSGRRVH